MSDTKPVLTVRKVTVVWVFLMVATLVAAAIGSAGHSGLMGAAVALGLLIAKAQLVVDHFMELRHVDWHWRLLLSAYSVVISGLVFAAYWMSVSS